MQQKTRENKVIMKLILKTDFVDYYDNHFDHLSQPEPHLVFNRLTRNNFSRKDLFNLLEEMNEPVIPHGNAKKLSEKFWSANKFVVYTDEYAHSGQGKLLIDRSQIPQYSDTFASLYMPEKPSLSLKKIVIGDRIFWAKYQSSHDWKSNVGDYVELYEPYEGLRINNKLFPIYTIDYVIGANYWWAVDLNTAPELGKLKLNISPEEIHQEIKNWYERLYDYG